MSDNEDIMSYSEHSEADLGLGIEEHNTEEVEEKSESKSEKTKAKTAKKTTKKKATVADAYKKRKAPAQAVKGAKKKKLTDETIEKMAAFNQKVINNSTFMVNYQLFLYFYIF